MPAPRPLASILALALAVALPLPARAAEHLRAGLWEITATPEVTGAPLTLPPATQTECLSQHEVEADPVPSLDKGACRATDVRREGGRVTWSLICSGALEGTGRGEIVQEGSTAYRGWMTLQAVGTTIKVTIRARRVGDC